LALAVAAAGKCFRETVFAPYACTTQNEDAAYVQIVSLLYFETDASAAHRARRATACSSML
jgi:hypothetical protein